MSSTRRTQARRALLVAGVVMLAWCAGGAVRAQVPGAAPADTAKQTVLGDTRANLQEAFTREVNAKARYLEAAQVAKAEGYPYIGKLFRACARAEQVHADHHVYAIAWTGDQARAFLERLAVGTTAENLRSAIDLETYEATELYPAMLAQARGEHMTAAVRSMNFALAAEREHARLFRAALETLDQRLPERSLFVCSQCGSTVESVDGKKCPNCFEAKRKFIPVE